eukprot:8103976-Pyramimonas_sp.AAC.3
MSCYLGLKRSHGTPHGPRAYRIEPDLTLYMGGVTGVVLQEWITNTAYGRGAGVFVWMSVEVLCKESVQLGDCHLAKRYACNAINERNRCHIVRDASGLFGFACTTQMRYNELYYLLPWGSRREQSTQTRLSWRWVSCVRHFEARATSTHMIAYTSFLLNGKQPVWRLEFVLSCFSSTTRLQGLSSGPYKSS